MVRLVSSAWAPVVAALGASILTGFFTWGFSASGQRRADRRDAERRQGEGYLPILLASNRLVAFGQVLRVMLSARTGVAEGLGVLLRLRKPIDTQDLMGRFATELTAILDAQAALQTVGTQAAVDAGERVVLVATEYLTACGEMTSSQRRWLEIRGWKPTRLQQENLEQKLRELFRARAAFIHVVRRDLDRGPVLLGIDQDEGA